MTLAAVWGSIVSTATAVWRDDRPERVLRFDGNSGVALATLTQFALADGGLEKRDTQRRLADLAKRAIASQPLNPNALIALGTVKALESGSAKAYPSFSLANSMSRRTPVAQMWLIEYEAQADKASRVLFHYDVMLRVQPQTGEVLFPIMASALEDRRLWPAFVPYFRNPPPWFEGFFRKAAATPVAVVPLAQIAGGQGRMPDSYLNRSLATQLLGSLVADGHFQIAKQYIGTWVKPSLDSLQAASLDEVGTDSSRIPFAWQLYATDTMSATFEGEGARRSLRASLGREAAGEIGNRTLMLRPGRYALSSRARVITAAQGASAQWVVECAKPKLFLTEAAVLGRGARANVSTTFEVPAGCEAQNLRLIGDAGKLGDGVDFAIDSVELRKLP